MSDLGQRHPNAPVAGALEQGRAAHEQRAWADAFRLLALADQAAPLGAGDLELFAMSAYLSGRDDDYLSLLDRAYRAHLDAGDGRRAVRCAFWLGLRLLFRGDTGRATGWLARARRLLEGANQECVEQGYLLLPIVQQHLDAGDCAAAYATADDAAGIGRRFEEPDLIAVARHLQGRTLLQQGQVEKGLALLDEVMVAVTTRELSPLVSGLIYCSVIEGCQQVYALGRAREWTSALARWCEKQQQLVAFTGTCHVHRAEIMQMNGAWQDAIKEARRAGERCVQAGNRQSAAAAFYRQAEIHRLRGELAAAEKAYRSASRQGWEPQPGLALLRLLQGRTETAAAAIRRVVRATEDQSQLAGLLPAHVEIMLAAGDVEEARGASVRLEAIAAAFGADMLGAMAAHARGAVALAEGDAQAALGSLRRALQVWQQLEAPYAAARVRVLSGLACRALGDDDGARLELGAARAIFEQLGAAPDLARLDGLSPRASPRPSHGLTPRELQVLRLIAAGKTNKAIAALLLLSGKTVDRHVSNIFTKLDVPSRAAATAYLYEHTLVA